MHQQLLGGVAHRRPLRLGIDHDRVGHVEVGGFIDEDVAVPGSGLDHRHRGILGDEGDQPRRPRRRNDHVHQATGLDEFLHGLPRVRIEQLDGTLRQSRHGGKNLHQPLIAARRFLAAAQHNGVAGLQRKHGCIDSDVRPRLVMIPTTPSGTRTLRMRRPFGRVHSARVS